MNSKSVLFAASLLALSSVGAFAQTIVYYDETNASPSGSGGWDNTYSGTITTNSNGTVNYSGGSGTLNDGGFGTSPHDTQLFFSSDATTVTLHLDGSYNLYSLLVYTGDFRSINYIPGNISYLTATIGGTSVLLTGTVSSTDAMEEVFTFDSSLSSLSTSSITLSGFGPGITGYYSIAELVVAGEPAFNTPTPSPSAVPEPSTYGLLGAAALGGLSLLRRRKRAA